MIELLGTWESDSSDNNSQTAVGQCCAVGAETAIGSQSFLQLTSHFAGDVNDIEDLATEDSERLSEKQPLWSLQKRFREAAT